MHHMKRWAGGLLLTLCVGQAVHAQECAAFVQDALTVTADLCAGVQRNQACYGNLKIEAVPQDGVPNLTFEAPGDLADIAQIQALNLSALQSPDEWGVAILSLQANLPETVPGQNVTVILFGDTTIESAAPLPPPTVSVTTANTINVRSGPSTSNRVVQSFRAGETLMADGQNAAGDWLRVQLADGTSGWVAASLVQVAGDSTTLAVVETTTGEGGLTYAPLQAFYLTTGVGAAGCAEAPQDGIVIQTPQGAGMVNLLINEVSVQLGSTVSVRAQADGSMTLDLIEGRSTVETEAGRVTLLPGTRAQIPLDAEGNAAGSPELIPIPEDGFNGLEGVVALLPEPVTLPDLLTQEEIEAALNARPQAGTWAVVDIGGGSFLGCIGIPLDSFATFSADLIPTDEGFTLTSELGEIVFIHQGDGHYLYNDTIEGAILNYSFHQLTPDEMEGEISIDISAEGLSCNATWRVSATRQ